MANPVLVDTPEGVWTKVATAVKSGYIHIIKTTGKYYQTYRATGEAAPSAAVATSEQVPVPQLGMAIDDAVGVDVYVKCMFVTGKVRLDS